MKSLVVEDDMISRRFLQTALSQYGDCDTASCGREAVEKFQESLTDDSPFDLITMDIMMPDMDGHETVSKIRHLENEHGIKSQDQVKVMMTSALDDADNADQAFFSSGARSYIIKPVTKEKLIGELTRLGLID